MSGSTFHHNCCALLHGFGEKEKHNTKERRWRAMRDRIAVQDYRWVWKELVIDDDEDRLVKGLSDAHECAAGPILTD